ncbi:hypothetical protein IGB42_03564 [Andreprevotia sp. IGB-42]|uniref:SRPBCC family protein n=1 Tax=Andreprevotia sp. IGB-42 TaxID=2497473 RepID=UPI001359B42B|nr:SRPBCC domain-containing protein [Andreprevotia sp. IGB-42]KAF0812022.1 hypothetical protein IGB42_03564 [Andreprevotia sp. IGB-42]
MTTDTAALAPGQQELLITRTFDAPRDLVWQAFTQAEHLAHWWGPKGFAIEVAALDVSPGGVFHYCMRAGNGMAMWGKFVYREVQAPERIVFTNSFSDEAGNTTRAPFNANWPLEVLNTWTFSEADGKTTLTLRGIPFNASEIEHAIFVAGFDSMRMGFGGTLDQLATYLALQQTG